MAILQRVSLFPNERFDLPDARAMEAFSQNDWRFFLSGVMTKKSYILSGMEITNYANIFVVPGIRLRQNNVAVLHPEATTQAAGFYVSAGSEADAQLQLSPNATNFVELDFSSSTGTPDTRAFWDEGADGGKGGEYTDDVDTVINLELAITSNVSDFTAGKIPLYRIVTNSSGVAIEVTDCRPLFFRLGTGGSSPNPDAEFAWPTNAPDSLHAQFETPIKALSATTSNAPYSGGDKNLKSFKDFMDAVMTGLMKMKSVPYWYMNAPTPAENYQNSSLSLLVGGTWKHETTPGRLSLQSGSTVYRLGKANNASLSPFTSLNLTANPVLFIILPNDASVAYGMGQNGTTPISPRAVISVTSSEVVVSGNGNYMTAGGKIMVRGQKFAYQSYSYDSINDRGTFSVITPDASGLVKAGDFVYQRDNASVAFYHYGASSVVPNINGHTSNGVEKTMWLCFYDGAKMHTPTSNLDQGEQIQVGDNTSSAIIAYIGSQGQADSSPIYNVGSIANGTNLTLAMRAAFNIIEKPIYDEIITDTAGTGWPTNTILTLPPNSRASNVAGVYTLGTGELEFYENGNFWRPSYDYTELSNNTIKLLRDVPTGSYVRFRIASIGGAGAAAGGGSTGESLQSVYANGRTITVSPGSPVEINGPIGQKLLRIFGDVEITGVLDPTGIELTPVAATPFTTGKVGLWVQNTSNLMMFTRPDGTALNVGKILENSGGDNSQQTRTYTNASLATIPAGSPVYIVSPRHIALAHCDSEQSAKFLGITAESIAANAQGKVIYTGVVPGIFAGLGLSVGYVWLGSNPGSITLTDPVNPDDYKFIIGLIDGDDLIIQPQLVGKV